MLDKFEIVTTSGVVIWSRSYSSISPAVIDNFITHALIEGQGAAGVAPTEDISAANNPPYKHDQHILRWTTVKELRLIFVAVYRSLLHLSWVDKLIDNIKTIFVDLYGDQLRKPHTTIVECDFDNYFDQQLRELEPKRDAQATLSIEDLQINEDKEASLLPEAKEVVPSALKDTPSATPDNSRPATPSSHLLAAKGGPGGRGSRRARKLANSPSAHASSGEESSSKKTRAGKGAPKKGRKWDADGLADEDSDTVLDYSATADADLTDAGDGQKPGTVEAVDQTSWGSKTGKGQFVLKDLDDEIHSMLAAADAKKAAATNTSTGLVGSSFNALGGLFRNVVGGKTLTKADLDKAMKGMEDHLLKKNVAREAAVRLCESVEQELIGVKTGSFESTQARVQSAMESALRKMLTPTNSLDLLREIEAVTSPSSLSLQRPRPYVISIVGVNGVGKSTNLSKICFFLLQNKYKVLVVACDTFRSGAVEQLAVHVRNLKELSEREGGQVELYQKGYGKDAAAVAKDAVNFAAQEGFDVVLIDTAGRRHNDQRLMSSLEKFAKFAQPDKILMVAEALVGTDSVAQARNFNAAFGATRKLDGFIISKCDTVGDMIGTLVSMVHASGIPISYVGVGQHYSDIRTLNVKWAVDKLLSPV